jgi:hypothetical protein
MLESFDWAIEHACGVDERGVGKIVDERMGEFSGERLGGGHGREVAVGKNNGGFGAEKRRKLLLKLRIDFVVAGGEARGGYIQSDFFQSRASRRCHDRMPREAKIIAAGKVKQRPISPTDFIRTDHLQWLRFSHGRMIDFARRNCTRECSSPIIGQAVFCDIATKVALVTTVDFGEKF